MGAPWPDSFVAITNAKLASPQALRTLALDGARISPKEAINLGIIDKLVPADSPSDVGQAVVSAARELAYRTAGNARAGAWGLIKVC
jgi:enoyl-CoA hydratase/carnithine racemase